ncbi:MAG: hypothetical protein ACJ8C4_10355 [Gemmataceae bacterium]
MSERNGPSTGDVDQLLTDFFHQEMPQPWPRIAPPDSAPRDITPAPRVFKRASTMPGRFALAASIAILALTSIWLAGRAPMPGNGGGVNLNEGTADPFIDKRPKEQPKNKLTAENAESAEKTKP